MLKLAVFKSVLKEKLNELQDSCSQKPVVIMIESMFVEVVENIDSGLARS